MTCIFDNDIFLSQFCSGTGDRRGLLCPVLYPEPLDLGEFLYVVRYDRRIIGKGRCGDEHVIPAYGSSVCRELLSD